MVKFVLYVALLSAVVSSIESTTIVEKAGGENADKGGLVFLGTATNITPRSGKSGRASIQTKSYYRSSNSAFWHDARQDCVDNLGPAASLLNIETAEELTAVSQFLDTGSTASTYWTGGRFDIFDEVYKWQDGTVFGSFLRWMPNHPAFNSAVTVVEAYVVGAAIRLRTNAQTETRRYICEV